MGAAKIPWCAGFGFLFAYSLPFLATVWVGTDCMAFGAMGTTTTIITTSIFLFLFFSFFLFFFGMHYTYERIVYDTNLFFFFLRLLACIYGLVGGLYTFFSFSGFWGESVSQ